MPVQRRRPSSSWPVEANVSESTQIVDLTLEIEILVEL